jgi:hypothetical protein
MKKSKSIISEYKAEYKGQSVIVHKIKPKERKVVNNARINYNSCPNCLSHIALDNAGLQKCSGDKLEMWNKEFIVFNQLEKEKQLEYLKNISFDSVFMELYDRWVYAQAHTEEPFGCGYTNKIFFPIPICQVIIPDPTQVHIIEKNLGRKLTEEEIFGESELFEYQGSILEKYKKGARTVKITLLRFPEDCY